MEVLKLYKEIDNYLNNGKSLDECTVWELREETNKMATLLGEGSYTSLTVNRTEEVSHENISDEPKIVSFFTVKSNLGVYETSVQLKKLLTNKKSNLLDHKITLREVLENA